MEMKRKVYDKLLEWKRLDHGTSAVLVNGARRVGKSFIVEEFAKREYRNYVMIDFATAKDDMRITDTFKTYLADTKEFFKRLSAIFGKKFYERETLFIFDEVQKFPRAREAIKKLVADGRYDFIETGSLVSIHENVKDILIPSEEIDIDMYPMDFEEFLWAKGNETLMDMIRECYAKRVPMGPLHRVAMDAFREYMIVGGMPQAVKKYIVTDDFKAVDREKRKILSLYRKGIREHAGALAERVEALYDFVPSQLQEHEKEVVLSSSSVAPSFTRTVPNQRPSAAIRVLPEVAIRSPDVVETPRSVSVLAAGTATSSEAFSTNAIAFVKLLLLVIFRSPPFAPLTLPKCV